jgi:serine/threonine-protein kinase
VSGPDEARFETGVAIDSFLLGERIGRGGMGEVWAARDLRLGRRVALKVVRAGRSGDRGAVARFLDEARITARLSHPNIVTAFAAGEWGGQPWVALESASPTTSPGRWRPPTPLASFTEI